MRLGEARRKKTFCSQEHFPHSESATEFKKYESVMPNNCKIKEVETNPGILFESKIDVSIYFCCKIVQITSNFKNCFKLKEKIVRKTMPLRKNLSHPFLGKKGGNSGPVDLVVL